MADNINTIKSYGIERSAGQDLEKQEYLLILQEKGYYVVENVFTPPEQLEIRKRLDAVYEIQQKEFGRDGLKSINELNVARSLLTYDPWFLQLARHPKIMEVIEKILGNYFILHLQNGILNTPNEEHHQSAWHRDLPYQSFTSSKPLAFNALICVDPFSEETGGTRFLPSSHLREDFPEIAEVQKNELSINAPAGSIIFFNSMLFHRAGVNVSNATRRAINQMYTLPIIKQQIDLPAALKDNYEQDPFLDRFLGYDSAVAASVIAWRSRRKARKIKANK